MEVEHETTEGERGAFTRTAHHGASLALGRGVFGHHDTGVAFSALDAMEDFCKRGRI